MCRVSAVSKIHHEISLARHPAQGLQQPAFPCSREGIVAVSGVQFAYNRRSQSGLTVFTEIPGCRRCRRCARGWEGTPATAVPRLSGCQARAPAARRHRPAETSAATEGRHPDTHVRCAGELEHVLRGWGEQLSIPFAAAMDAALRRCPCAIRRWSAGAGRPAAGAAVTPRAGSDHAHPPGSCRLAPAAG